LLEWVLYNEKKRDKAGLWPVPKLLEEV
jgi:hypothetical protein